jgi:MSHA biogenesis protein MshK
MDEAVIPTTMKPAFGAALLALLLAGGAYAQPLQDPTRPPAAATPVAAGPQAVTSGPQLQSILIGRAAGGRHVAVIDGETVRQGESFRGAKVVRIRENEVELVRGAERQVLRLYAEAEGGIKGDHAATVTVRR